MPPITCPSCSNQISDQAQNCPQCGRPIVSFTPAQKEVAKNVAGLTSGCFWLIVGILILILTLVFFLVIGISSHAQTRPRRVLPPSEAPAPSPTPAPTSDSPYNVTYSDEQGREIQVAQNQRRVARKAGRRRARNSAPRTARRSARSSDYYTNVEGKRVHRPTFSRNKPSGATAQCRDGSYSFSQHHRGTCSHHGGVARWL